MVESGPMTDHDPHSEGVAAESFSRQSPVGYTGIVPKYVKKGGFLPGRSQTQATDSPENA